MPHGGGRGRRERKGTAGGSKIPAVTNAATFSAALKEIAFELIEEVVKEVGLEVGGAHSSGVLGALGLLDTEPPSELHIKSEHEMKQKDVFGQDVSKVNRENLYVECDYCNKKLISSRFGDHLAKCILGQGRGGKYMTPASPSKRMVEVKVEPGTTSKKGGCGDPTMPHGGGRGRRERKWTAGGSKIPAVTNAATFSAALKEIAFELIEEVVKEVGLEVGGAHSSGVLGALGLLDTEPPSELHIKSEHEMKQKDVFGQDVSKVNRENLYVECDYCNEKLISSRFGDHLAKCILGQGRGGKYMTPASPMVEVKVEPGTTSKKRGCGDPTMPDISTNLQGKEFGFSSSALEFLEGIGGKNNLQIQDGDAHQVSVLDNVVKEDKKMGL